MNSRAIPFVFLVFGLSFSIPASFAEELTIEEEATADAASDAESDVATEEQEVLAAMELFSRAHCEDGTYQGYLDLLDETIFAPAREMVEDREQATGYFYWGRLRYAIESLPDPQIDHLFNPETGVLREREFKRLYWAVVAGGITVTEEQEKMITDLEHLIREVGGRFWSAETQAYHIRDRLREIDERHGYSGEADVAAEFTAAALVRTERELLARAIGEGSRPRRVYPNTRWTDRWAHWWAPHYSRVSRLLDRGYEFRMQMALMYLADEPLIDALNQYEGVLPFTDEELTRIRAMVSDTAEKLFGVREELFRVYGREFTALDPLLEEEMRLREILRRALNVGSTISSGEIVADTEQELDFLDATIERARAAKGLTPERPLAEVHDVHLRFRFPQYIRDTARAHEAYLVTTSGSPNNSSYPVQTKWKVREQHSEVRTRVVVDVVSDGKGGTTTRTRVETYIHHWSEVHTVRARDDVLNVHYEEVLSGEMNPNAEETPPAFAYNVSGKSSFDSASVASRKWIHWYDEERSGEVLEKGRAAREREAPYRDRLIEANEELGAINPETYPDVRDDEEWRLQTLDALDSTRADLERLRAELLAYVETADAEILEQWEDDVPKDFRLRNQALIDRYDQMIHRLSYVREQIRRRTESLINRVEQPDWTPQLEELKKIHERIRGRQTVAGLTVGGIVASGAVASAMYPEEAARVWDCAKALVGF